MIQAWHDYLGQNSISMFSDLQLGFQNIHVEQVSMYILPILAIKVVKDLEECSESVKLYRDLNESCQCQSEDCE